ncbi:MAG TPA: CHC2 zinc finger domain-containing protein [Rhodanobacteraceae bacterium]
MNARRGNESARRQPGAETSRFGTRGRAQQDRSVFGSVAQRGRFRRDRLPSAATFYTADLDKLGKPNGNGWAMARCPFHDDAHASLSVNLRGGHFRCHACGARGPGIVAFVMLRDNLDFEGACRSLGAWEVRR